jgi:hypothetical protein
MVSCSLAGFAQEEAELQSVDDGGTGVGKNRVIGLIPCQTEKAQLNI